MTGFNNKIRMFHDDCQEELKHEEGKKFYLVSCWGNFAGLFFFIIVWLGLTFGPLYYLFTLLYYQFGILNLSRKPDFGGLILVMSVSCFVLAATTLVPIIIIERILARALNRISAVIDDDGMTAEVIDSYDIIGLQHFEWKEITSVRYEFNFPSRNHFSFTNAPKLHIKINDETPTTAVFGAPLNLLLELKNKILISKLIQIKSEKLR